MKPILKNKRGATMVELVVTFALLALFLASAVVMFSVCLRIYDEAKSKADARSVTETIMDKVAGEISGAQGGSKDIYTMMIQQRGEDPNVDNTLPYEDRACIAFCNRTGSQVYIATTEDHQLLIHYRPVTDNNLNWKAVDWTFDDAVYKNYQIQSLTFESVQKDGRRTNVIRVDLTVQNIKTGFTRSSTRYVECYNFSDTEISKIVNQAIPVDQAG